MATTLSPYSIMDTLFALSALGIFIILYRLCQRFSCTSVAAIPGPESKSFILGHLPEYLGSQAGEIHLIWQKQFGDVVKYKGFFGKDHLLVSDPKAIQYILHTGGYRFVKPPERRVASKLLSGIGLNWAEGNDHKRHRWIMTPAFGTKQCRDLVPLFAHYAAKVSEKWKAAISSNSTHVSVFDVSDWLSRATLDAMGAGGLAAFDYHFHSLDNANDELGRSFTNLCLQAFGQVSVKELYDQAATQCIPKVLSEYLTKKVLNTRLDVLANVSVVSTRVAQEMIDTKQQNVSLEENRDVMSLLVRANNSEDEKSRMSNEEMVAQMRTLLLAGFETTATSLTWTMYELARHPDIHNRLRREIYQKQGDMKRQGASHLFASDFEDMPYLTAVVKESLRMYPAAYALHRQPVKDEVIPLSKPVKLLFGEDVTATVPKGTNIVISVNGLNRHKAIFGEDADVYDPNRWLRPNGINSSIHAGVYANSLTFSGGVRSCIGWRFVVLELHAFVTELVGNFEFSMTPEATMVRREACLIMTPTIEGHTKKSRYLPLNVEVVKRHD